VRFCPSPDRVAVNPGCHDSTRVAPSLTADPAAAAACKPSIMVYLPYNLHTAGTTLSVAERFLFLLAEAGRNTLTNRTMLPGHKQWRPWQFWSSACNCHPPCTACALCKEGGTW
jgi:hypothetical protein